MGYTNSWKVKSKPATIPQDFIEEVKSFVDFAKKEGYDVKFRTGEDEKGNWLCVDGEHESFYLDTNEGYGFDSFRFCKTNREPYDAVVKCLCSLGVQYDLFDSWDFDGDPTDDEYLDAKELAEKAGLEWYGSVEDTDTFEKPNDEDFFDYNEYLMDESKNVDLPYLDEDEIIERIIIANDLDMDEIEEYGTDEYWIDNDIRNLQDLDSLYDDFIKDCDDKELKQIFKNQYLNNY